MKKHRKVSKIIVLVLGVIAILVVRFYTLPQIDFEKINLQNNPWGITSKTLLSSIDSTIPLRLKDRDNWTTFNGHGGCRKVTTILDRRTCEIEIVFRERYLKGASGDYIIYRIHVREVESSLSLNFRWYWRHCLSYLR